MKNLKQLVKYCKIKVLNGGQCPILSSIEREYKKMYSINPRSAQYEYSITPSIGMKIADVYDDLQHQPENLYVKAAYNQLAIEVAQQFKFLNLNEKVVYEPYEGNGEPYKNSFEMLTDFHNFHLYFFKTESGFGEVESDSEHSLLQKTGLFTQGYELLYNDLFRIVHDVFGHAMKGNGFGPKGEDRAWFTHIQMFSPLAATALTTETRGQNCWVNFGPHLRNSEGELYSKSHAKWTPPNQRPFADQKMNLLPEFVSGVRTFKDNGSVKAIPLPFWNPLESIQNN